MRYKRALRRALMCALALCLTPWTAPARAVKAAPAEILVVYPEDADRLRDDDSVSALAQALLSLRHSADFVEAGSAAPVIGDYEYVIWCATTASERMDAAMLAGYDGSLLALGRADGLERFGIRPVEGLEGDQIGVAEYAFIDELPFYASLPALDPGAMDGASNADGSLEVMRDRLPLGSGLGGVRYLPLVDYSTPFAKAVLIQEIARWLWPYDTHIHTYTGHIVLDAVYPFADPYRLRDVVEYMVKKKMHFVISVMPIYEHADYPAMQQFCEVLRYAQANGGAVIMHAPIVQGPADAAAVADRLTTATRNYLNNGVYPLALEAPAEWLFDRAILDVLSRYKTLFLYGMDAFSNHAATEYDFDSYLGLGSQQIVPALKLDETGISHLACCATAVYLDFSALENEALFAVIDAAKDAPIPMQSLWDIEQDVYIDNGHISWKGNTLLVDGEQRFNAYEPVGYDESFDYKRNIYYRFVANLANQNHLLIGISAVVLALFIVLGVRSRRQMHRRFLIKKTGGAQRGDDNVGG